MSAQDLSGEVGVKTPRLFFIRVEVHLCLISFELPRCTDHHRIRAFDWLNQMARTKQQKQRPSKGAKGAKKFPEGILKERRENGQIKAAQRNAPEDGQKLMARLQAAGVENLENETPPSQRGKPFVAARRGAVQLPGRAIRAIVGRAVR